MPVLLSHTSSCFHKTIQSAIPWSAIHCYGENLSMHEDRSAGALELTRHEGATGVAYRALMLSLHRPYLTF